MKIYTTIGKNLTTDIIRCLPENFKDWLNSEIGKRQSKVRGKLFDFSICTSKDEGIFSIDFGDTQIMATLDPGITEEWITRYYLATEAISACIGIAAGVIADNNLTMKPERTGGLAMNYIVCRA